jgi:hypothetical protein
MSTQCGDSLRDHRPHGTTTKQPVYHAKGLVVSRHRTISSQTTTRCGHSNTTRVVLP